MEYKLIISKADDLDAAAELLRALHAKLIDGEALSIEKIAPPMAEEQAPDAQAAKLREQMEVLQEILESQGVNQVSLASKIGINPGSLCALLHGKGRLSNAVAKKILNSLRLKPQLAKRLEAVSLPVAVMRSRRSR